MKTIFGKKLLLLAGTIVMIFIISSAVYSHCQLPCGIYNDEMRFDMMTENITTIEKSINIINQLAGKQTSEDLNQLVRWVNNKEDHSEQLSHSITYYFMAQRIKPAEKADAASYEKYIAQLTLLHKMLITSMKAKQTVDISITKQLSEQLAEFKKLYSGQTEQKH